MKYRQLMAVLQEGVYDKNILKAFFLAGGPGSGKSFVTRSAFAGAGLKLIDSDRIFTRNLEKANLSLKMPDEEGYFRDIIRNRAKITTQSQLATYIEGRLGMIVDGTGRDFDQMNRQVTHLKSMGYDCYMIFVNTSLPVALERNAKRDRVVPEYIATKNWNTVQRNTGKFQNLFGMSNFFIIDNNKSDKELQTLTLSKAASIVNKMLSQPVRNYIGKTWIAKEMLARRRK